MWARSSPKSYARQPMAIPRVLPTAPPTGTFPFTTTAPPIGTYESPTLEFKLIVAVKGGISQFELAKDVSALANAQGGTILVGARAGNSQLVKWEPIEDDALARQIALAYENAVKDRCGPPAQFSVQSITSPTGSGLLLAIHVPPSPAMVAVKTPARDGEWHGDAWVYFRREAASQNKEMRPEMLPMFTTPEIRRTVILLQSIPDNAKIHVRAVSLVSGNREDQDAEGVEVDEMRNVARFRGAHGEVAVAYPLDLIASVFDQGDGKWLVLVRAWYR